MINYKMRKIIVISGIIFIALTVIAIIAALIIKNEAREVTFEFNDQIKAVEIMQDNGKDVEPTNLGEVSSEKPKIKLADGFYYYVPKDDDYTGSYFAVDNETKTVQIHISYSDEYYKKMEKYTAQLDKILAKEYPKTYVGKFNLQKVASYEDGNYMSALVVNKENTRNFYRVLFKKEGDDYKLLSDPQIYFYKNNFKDVPDYILDLANRTTI